MVQHKLGCPGWPFKYLKTMSLHKLGCAHVLALELTGFFMDANVRLCLLRLMPYSCLDESSAFGELCEEEEAEEPYMLQPAN